MSALRTYLEEREAALLAELQPMWDEANIVIAELASVRCARHAINNPLSQPKRRGRRHSVLGNHVGCPDKTPDKGDNNG